MCGVLLSSQSSRACVSWVSVAVELGGHQLIWFSPFVNFRRNAGSNYFPLPSAFINLTKAFDLVNWDDLFLLTGIVCPPKLFSLLQSLHINMQGTVVFIGNCPGPFSMRSGIKQGSVLLPSLFGNFFSVLPQHACGSTSSSILFHSHSDSHLFNLVHLKAETKIVQVKLRDFCLLMMEPLLLTPLKTYRPSWIAFPLVVMYLDSWLV